jgi:PTH1 family peptidyl-tRNA hydrolase
MRLLVGLGNPGPSYEATRHNAGAWLVESVAEAAGLSLKPDRKFQGSVATLRLEGGDCFLLRPSSYMNLSGQAIRALAHFYKITPDQIVVAHDELDLPVGVARLKQGGGHGGHNGLRDTMAQLSSPDFWRIRIGIGHPGQRDLVHDYVLGKPSVADRQLIMGAIERVLPLLPGLSQGQWQKAMMQLHTVGG